MTTTTKLNPFHLQPLLSDLYYHKDLLDFSAAGRAILQLESQELIPGPSSPPPAASGSLLSSAASIAAAAGRRATSTASPASSPAKNTAANDDGPRKEVNCVEGYDKNVYIGRSDGVVEWWVLDGNSGDDKHNGWTQRHKHTLFPRRGVNKIILLPKVSKCFILSDGTLHAFMLPSLEPLPSTTIQTLRGVVNVVLNDDELDWGGPGTEGKATDMTVIVVRRKGLGVYRVGARMLPVKELPLPSGPTAAAMFGTSLCAAIPSTNTYSLIDLGDMSLTEVLPVSQVEPSELDWVPNANVVVIPGGNEFLVTSYTGSTTIGVFLNGQGDPVRGTIEWQHHPLAITTDSGFILALLRNNTIEMHLLEDLDKPYQIVEIDPSFSPRSLTYSPYGIAIRDAVRDASLAMSRMLLLESKLPKRHSSTTVPTESTEMPMLMPETRTDLGTTPPEVASPPVEEPASGSGLTPPSSPTPFQRQPIAPTRTSSLLKATAPPSRTGLFSLAVSETFLVGPNGIQSVAPTSIISRVDYCCAIGSIDEAMNLVDEERRKGRRGEFETDKTTHQGTMRFLHLLVASYLMSMGMFAKAGDYFAKGKVDPRIIVRSFPDLRGKLIGSAEEVEVYHGLKEVLSSMPSIDDIVSRRIEKEGLKEADRERLLEEAHGTLAEFLRKTRTLRRKGGGSRGVDSRKLDMVIDTTLAKLLANSGDTPDLLSLLAGSNDCVSSELEPFLEQRPYVLVTVMRIQGRIDRVLELLQSIAESDRPEPLCPDPIGELAQTLGEISDPVILLKYILWLAPRDADKALTILMNQGTKAGMKLDDAALIDELRKHSAEAARRYLEHVVVSKKSPNKALHRELLDNLFHGAEDQLANDGVKYHLEELDSEYRLRSGDQPYCVFLAEIAPATPIKLIRLKLLLFLQGSPFFDLSAAADRIGKLEQLKPELAVVLGRLGRNKQALQLLARDIGDSVSAQTYCTQGGEIIPPRVAKSVARHVPELADWAALGEIGRKRRGTVDAKTQERLVMELLGVYMREGASTAKQTAALLNAQSVHLDVLEVLALVPPEWPLDVVSSFFQRSLRRQLHDKASGEILKAISAGQNMETSEKFLDAITQMPPHILQPGPNDPSPGGSLPSQPDEGSVAEKEYATYEESHTNEHNEKYSTPADALLEKEGFFDQDSVDKELIALNAQRRREGESLR